MHMGSCIACHAAKSAPTTCDTCHAVMSKNGTPGRTPFDADATVLARLNNRPAAAPSTGWSSFHTTFRAAPQLATLATFLHAPTL
jgi:hypothetical protein